MSTISTTATTTAGMPPLQNVGKDLRPPGLLIFAVMLGMMAARKKRMKPRRLMLAMAGGL
jgi:hypothetical protein